MRYAVLVAFGLFLAMAGLLAGAKSDGVVALVMALFMFVGVALTVYGALNLPPRQ